MRVRAPRCPVFAIFRRVVRFSPLALLLLLPSESLEEPFPLRAVAVPAIRAVAMGGRDCASSPERRHEPLTVGERVPVVLLERLPVLLLAADPCLFRHDDALALLREAVERRWLRRLVECPRSLPPPLARHLGDDLVDGSP